jgi:hypothetical protein
MNEEELEEQNHIADMLGMIDYQHYLEYKERAINGLMIFGSKFQEALGMALSEADERNAVKIIHTWKNECSVHEMLYKMHLAKQITLDTDTNNASYSLSL